MVSRGGRRWVLPAILLLALVLRVAVVLDTPHYRPAYDSGDYDRSARSIAAGNGYPHSHLTVTPSPSAFRPPLYPYLLGGVYAIVGASAGIDAGRVLGALFGTLVVFLIWILGRELWDPLVGRLAALLAAVFPPLIFLNAALLTEPLFVSLELGALLAVLVARRRGDRRWAMLAGGLCGLAALTRGNGALLAIPAALGVWTVRPRFSRDALLMPVAVAATTLLVIMPWTIRNAVTFHRLIPVATQNGFAMAGIFNEVARKFPGYPGTWVLPSTVSRYRPLFFSRDLNEAELDGRLRSRALSYAADHPLYTVQETALNTLRILSLAPSPDALTGADNLQIGLRDSWVSPEKWSWFFGWAIALVGIATLLRGPRKLRGPLFVWASPALMVLAAGWAIGSHRYRAPVYPFVVLLAAVALAAAARRLTGSAGGEGDARQAQAPAARHQPLQPLP